MKKGLLVLLVVYCLFPVFALQNTFGPSSDEYRDLMTLCSVSGVRPAIMVLPVSADQMLRIMDAIPVSKLDDVSRAMYDDLRNKLESPSVVIDQVLGNGRFATDFAIETSLQAIKQSQSEFDFLVAKKDRKPMLLIGADLFFNDFLYAKFTIDVTDIDNGATYGSTEGYKTYTTNLMKKLGIQNNIDFTFPHKAFVSIGTNGMNLTVGRDRLSLGNGKTGNLVLGDNLWFQDFAKASVVSGTLSYGFTVMSFENTYTTRDEDGNITGCLPLKIANDYTVSRARQMVFLHDLSFRPTSWLSLSLSEGALVYGTTALMDLRKLNPFFILHNVFDYSDSTGKNLGNMNNFFGFELSAALPYGFAVNSQFVFDQIQLSGEHGSDNPQSAYGVLLNVTKSGSLFNGVYDAYLEGVYTSPNLYLKEKDVKCEEYWNMDLIVGKKLYWTTAGNDDVSYLGYKHGPDSVVIGAGFDWRDNKGLEVDFSALYRIHGEQGIQFYDSQKDTTITYGEDPDMITGDNLERRLVLDLCVSKAFDDYLDLEGEVGFIHAANYRNTTSSFTDLQFAVSATLKADGFFDKTELTRP